MIETSLSTAEATEERVRHDARAVADVCAAGPLADDLAQVLAVLRTDPAAYSGSASVQGIFLDAATGRLVDGLGAPAGLEGRPPIIRYEGSYDVLEVLSGPAGELDGRYSWTEPLPEHTRGFPPNGVYDPFARPGVVLCRHDPTAHGAPFDQVRLLPEGWQADAAAAVRAAPEPDASIARDWLTGTNDLLFARAAGTLALTGQLDQRLVESVRGQAHGYRRAVLHYVTLAFAEQRPGQWDALDSDLADSEPDHRRAAALGLLAARLFAPAASAVALAGWPRLTSPAGLLDPALAAADGYVRAAFTLLTTGSQA